MHCEDIVEKTKKCMSCGAALPPDAAFCPCCTASQVERRPMAPPRTGRKRRRTAWLCGGAAALAAAVLWAAQPLPAPPPDTPEVSEPQGLDGAMEADFCQTWYEGADGRLYHVFACFSPQPDGGALPASHRRLMQPAGAPGTSPLCVFAEDAEDSRLDARDAFAALVDRHTVVAVPAEGSASCIIYEETQSYADAGALFAHEHQIDSSCTYNDIIWTLYMKNGDEITLRQVVECQEQPAATYSWEDIPLTTTAELQALLDRLTEEVSAETDVTVLLPAATYDEPLHIRRAVQLQAHADGTTFTAPVTVECLPESMEVDMHVVLQECRFLGQGGTGVTAHAPTYLQRCWISGWDVGALAADNGWIWVQRSEFSRNGVALCIDTNGSSSWSSDVNNGSFVRNDTAVRLVEIPGDWMTLRLRSCTFYGNTTLLDNVGGVRAELDADCIVQET